MTRRAVVAAALISAPALLLPLSRTVTFAIVNSILLFLIALDVLRAPKVETLSPSLVAPHVMTMNVRGSGKIVMHNANSHEVVVATSTQTLPSLNLEPRRSLVKIPPGELRSMEFSVSPQRRGNFVIGPITFRVFGTLGLAGRQTQKPITLKLKVYPPLPARKQVALRIERARMLQAGERSTAIRGGGTSFDSLRDYHLDDEFRRINWSATARATRPISNVYTEERNQQLVLLLDAGRTMAANIQGVTRFEHGIDAAIAVSDLAGHVGDHVGLVAFGSDVLAMIPPRSGKSHSKRILDSVFAIETSLDASNYRKAFSAMLSRYRRRALLVLVTELLEESTMESLFASLPSLLTRHLVLLGSVRDPLVHATSRMVPKNSEEAYLKSAASESLLRRERTAVRLAGMGVTVIDRNPSELAGHLADEYLRVKAHGRL